MRTSNAAIHLLTAFAALAMLAGCSAGSLQSAPTPQGHVLGAGTRAVQQQAVPLNSFLAMRKGIVSSSPVKTPGYMSRDAVGKALIFVSDIVGGVVNIYEQAGNKLVGQITGISPGGLATDTAGNLYVDGNQTVLVYAPPYTGTPTSLVDTGFPVDVAVSSRGIVGVANFCSVPNCPPDSGNVTIYAQNSTTACATVANPFLNVFFDAVDDEGNVYFTAFDTNRNHVIGEIKGGCKANKITLLTTTNTIAFTGGIQVDKHDRISILNRDAGNIVIDTYKAPKNGSLGAPISITQLITPAAPFNFAFLASNADLYTAEQGGGGIASKYDFPVGGQAEKTIAVGGAPFGVAVYPPLVP